ncbi:MAG TPA: hypothetical protein VKV73_27435 [Chloroflexota bacterium]|nr:hypothetical protein [Chloroflexota bacterium]
MLRSIVVVLLLFALMPVDVGAAPAVAQTEPQAGQWHTWVLTSGSQVRPAPPPNAAASQAELDQLRALAQQRDGASLDQIAFWDTGAPSYRWNELTVTEALKHNLRTNNGWRALALVHVGLSDAMVATWDAKYTYQRPRPTEVDESLTTVVPTPASPAYPSEHAAAWNEQASEKILEDRLDTDPPRVARAYALQSIAGYDSGVACWDAKYAYWAIRPFQLSPTLSTVFPTPNHPSYPAAHGCFSSAAAAALASLFPRDAETLNALADELQ